VWRYVAAMKKEGIYSLICPYWALTVKPPKSWGVDVAEGKDAHNLLYFDPQMRAIYKNWLRIMLTEKNPYTGIALKDDPALAILQLQNEDSLSSGHSTRCPIRRSVLWANNTARGWRKNMAR
jgi:hypothetical protein